MTLKEVVVKEVVDGFSLHAKDEEGSLALQHLRMFLEAVWSRRHLRIV
jgi:hypothetical protein